MDIILVQILHNVYSAQPSNQTLTVAPAPDADFSGQEQLASLTLNVKYQIACSVALTHLALTVLLALITLQATATLLSAPSNTVSFASHLHRAISVQPIISFQQILTNA